jgi:hypothetical protein
MKIKLILLLNFLMIIDGFMIKSFNFNNNNKINNNNNNNTIIKYDNILTNYNSIIIIYFCIYFYYIPIMPNLKYFYIKLL